MLKKKNIAMAMAATVVATSVAPAFAASLDGTTVSLADATKMAELRTEIEGLLNTTYSTNSADLYDGASSNKMGQQVYTIKAIKNDTVAKAESNGTTITSMRDLEKMISSLEKENDYLSISVVDAGSKEVDGKVVDWKISEYDKNLTGLPADGAIAEVGSEVSAGTIVRNGKTAQITMLNNDEPMYVTVGDVEIDTTKAIYKKDENGNFLDKEGKITSTAANKVVVGFEKKKNALTPTDKNKFDGFTVKYANQNSSELTTSELLNSITGRLTVKGNELAKYIRDYNAKITKLVADGVPGFVVADKIDTADIVKDTDSKIELTISVPKNIAGVEAASTRAAGDFATITVKGAEGEIDTLVTKLHNVVTTNKVETLGGSDRIQTAIEVSKDTFAKNGAGQNVVLVSDKVIADGLAATPFANAVNAPVLLTNKDSISDELMAEIERVLGSNGKVYLVGGESVLTPELEKQLDSKFVDFERIAGDDRYDTSLEIAKRIVKLNGATAIDKVFVAGGYAEVDTMSVAGVAATDIDAGTDGNQVNPILLVGKNGLTKEQTNWMKFNAKATPAYIIGGKSHVSEETQSNLDDLTTAAVKRLSGDGRQETNAAVIKEFYEGATVNSINDLYIAKSDNKGLVDALSAGVAAAKTGAPVILATNELAPSQKAVLADLNGDNTTQEFNTTVNTKQVGYGIADKVWEAIKGIF